MIDKKKQGKKNRKSGAEFEKKVREDLESKEWVVIKNPNNVIKNSSDEVKLTQAKSKWNPITKKPMMISQGFPDFICFRNKNLNEINLLIDNNYINDGALIDEKTNFFMIENEKIEKKFFQKINDFLNLKEVIGVECKINGYLSKEEKDKCKWLLDNKIFSKILIASKIKENNKIKIKYIEFK